MIMELIKFDCCDFVFLNHVVSFYPIKKGYRVEVTQTTGKQKTVKFTEVLNPPSLHVAETLILKLFKD